MNLEQRIAMVQHRMSELRSSINAYPEDGDPDELEKQMKEYEDCERKYRMALRQQSIAAGDGEGQDPNAASGEPQKRQGEEPHRAGPVEVPTDENLRPEDREFNRLHQRASLGRVLQLMYEEKELDGVEREYRDAWFPGGQARRSMDEVIPLGYFLPQDEVLHQQRADAATTVSAGANEVMTRPIAARVFARTDSAFLGARFLNVSAGRQRFPYVSGGASLVYRNEGEDVDAAAGTITIESSDPREATLAYLVGKTSMLQFAEGELERALREDARMAIEEGMDITIIQGRAADHGGVTSAAIDGLEDSLTAASDVNDTITAAAFLAYYSGRVDGKYAYTWMDVRSLVRQEVYQKVCFLPVTTNGDRFISELLGPDRMRASTRLTAPSSGKSDIITYAPMNDRGDLVVPVWDDVGVIIDPYTEAKSGRVRLTFDLAHNVKVLRNDPWKLHKVKHT